jgi:hypothetical protein
MSQSSHGFCYVTAASMRVDDAGPHSGGESNIAFAALLHNDANGIHITAFC